METKATAWFLAWASPEVEKALEEYKREAEDLCRAASFLTNTRHETPPLEGD